MIYGFFKSFVIFSLFTIFDYVIPSLRIHSFHATRNNHFISINLFWSERKKQNNFQILEGFSKYIGFFFTFICYKKEQSKNENVRVSCDLKLPENEHKERVLSFYFSLPNLKSIDVKLGFNLDLLVTKAERNGKQKELESINIL